MRKEVEDNLIQARADLKTARDNISLQNYHAVAFYSQQAAEKALKALFFVRESKAPAKTHNLITLLLPLSSDSSLREAASFLTPAVVLSRYSDVLGMPPVQYYTVDIAQKSVKYAEVILRWVEKELRK